VKKQLLQSLPCRRSWRWSTHKKTGQSFKHESEDACARSHSNAIVLVKINKYNFATALSVRLRTQSAGQKISLMLQRSEPPDRDEMF
jgi:hypothetical protein